MIPWLSYGCSVGARFMIRRIGQSEGQCAYPLAPGALHVEGADELLVVTQAPHRLLLRQGDVRWGLLRHQRRLERDHLVEVDAFADPRGVVHGGFWETRLVGPDGDEGMPLYEDDQGEQPALLQAGRGEEGEIKASPQLQLGDLIR